MVGVISDEQVPTWLVQLVRDGVKLSTNALCYCHPLQAGVLPRDEQSRPEPGVPRPVLCMGMNLLSKAVQIYPD